jgi:hypothetical protein
MRKQMRWRLIHLRIVLNVLHCPSVEMNEIESKSFMLFSRKLIFYVSKTKNEYTILDHTGKFESITFFGGFN